MNSTLRVTEIFRSLQGESRSVGWPTTFIRLTGCPLRCQYCDTTYAFHGGENQSISQILEQTQALGATKVTVTGGEPMAQRNTRQLLTALCDAGFEVSLETSGAVSIDDVDKRVRIVLDVKTPGSGEETKNRLSNLDHLKSEDELKFVVTNMDDFQWSLNFIDTHGLENRCDVLISPVNGPDTPKQFSSQLADAILASGKNFRFQLQLHKLLWGDVAGK